MYAHPRRSLAHRLGDALFSEESGYATPKLDIRAVVLDGEGSVLLVREKEDGLWTPPGGWVDVGESSSETAERQVKEESGYEVSDVRLSAWRARRSKAEAPVDDPIPLY